MKNIKTLFFLTKIIYLLLLSTFLSCTFSRNFAHYNKTKLIYENDQNGKVVFGSVDKLIKAIEKGAEVRVLMISGNSEYAVDAEQVWIKNGMVYIQNTKNISCTFSGDNLEFQDNAYHYYFILNSNGERNVARWLVGEHTPLAESSEQVAVKWFVK